MSAWRLVVKVIAKNGGPMKAMAISAELGMSPKDAACPIKTAAIRGMIQRGEGRSVWMLTEQGADFDAGTLVFVRCAGNTGWIPRRHVAELADVDRMTHDLAQRLARMRERVPSRDLDRVEQFCAMALRVIANTGPRTVLGYCRESREAWIDAGLSA